MKQLRPAEAAQQLGVSVKTLQRWDNDGIFVAGRTASGRRYYTEQQIKSYLLSANRNTEKINVHGLRVFYIISGSVQSVESNDLLQLLMTDKDIQKKYGVYYSKEKDLFLGLSKSIETIVELCGLVIENSDKSLSVEERQACITICNYELSEYLKIDWESMDFVLPYGIGEICIDMGCQFENASEIAKEMFENGTVSIYNDWYLGTLMETKRLIFDSIIFNLRFAMSQIERTGEASD